MLCNSLTVSADVQFAMPDDQLFSGTYNDFVILSRRHTQAVIDEAEDIGWNAINMDYDFYCDALVRARMALSRMTLSR